MSINLKERLKELQKEESIILFEIKTQLENMNEIDYEFNDVEKFKLETKLEKIKKEINNINEILNLNYHKDMEKFK